MDIEKLSRSELKLYLKVLQDKTMWNRELIKAVKSGLNIENEMFKVNTLLSK